MKSFESLGLEYSTGATNNRDGYAFKLEKVKKLNKLIQAKGILEFQNYEKNDQ